MDQELTYSFETLMKRSHRRSMTQAILAMPAIWVMVILIVIAILAPIVTSYDPIQVDFSQRLQSPSSEHWFGTDGFGMDIFTRIVYGARKDLLLAFSSAGLAASIGSLLGAISGYTRGGVDDIIQRMTEVIQTFPVVLFAIAVLTALGVTLLNLVIVIAIINVPVYQKMVRSIVLPMRSASFIEAARCAGHSSAGIIVRHVLPNTAGPVLAQFSINCAWAIQVISGLSFLGLGVKIPEPEWGLMVQQGSTYIVTGEWWVAFFPGMAIVIGVYAFHMLGMQIKTVVSLT